MEMCQCVLQPIYGLLCNSVRVGNVTKFEESAETVHHFAGNMALDGWQINLD